MQPNPGLRFEPLQSGSHFQGPLQGRSEEVGAGAGQGAAVTDGLLDGGQAFFVPAHSTEADGEIVEGADEVAQVGVGVRFGQGAAIRPEQPPEGSRTPPDVGPTQAGKWSLIEH